jgi:hypothetical protein
MKAGTLCLAFFAEASAFSSGSSFLFAAVELEVYQ